MKRLFMISSLILLLTGCSFLNGADKNSDKSNMKDEYSIIKSFVDREMELRKGKLELVDSLEGISAVKDIDVDGDGEKEKIVTYSVGTDSKTLHFLILKKQSDIYSVVRDVELRGEEIDRVILKDLTHDGKDDIIINSLEGNSKILTIYSLEDDIKKLMEIDYSTYVVDDIDGDNSTDIVIFKNIADILSADYYRYNKNANKIEFINENITHLNLKSVSKPIVGHISRAKRGLVLYGNDGMMDRYTLLFGIDESGKLVNMLKPGEPGETPAFISKENQDFIPRDVNDDGIIDIPKSYPMLEKDEGFTLNIDNYINCVEWYNYKKDNLAKISSYVYLEGDKVYFAYPRNWENTEITGSKRSTASGAEYNFSKRGNKSGRKENLMTIIRTDKKPEPGYRLIKKSKSGNYYIKTEKNIPSEEIEPYIVDENYIIDNFFIKDK